MQAVRRPNNGCREVEGSGGKDHSTKPVSVRERKAAAVCSVALQSPKAVIPNRGSARKQK